MNEKERQIAKAVMFASNNLGRAAMLLFTVFLFTGAWGVLDLGFSAVGVLIWNGALSLVFFIQHSTMIRRGFRERMSRTVPVYYLNAVFSLVSSVLLMAVVVLWQPSATVIYQADGLAHWVLRSVFVLGLAGTVWGSIALKSIDPFGGKAIRDYLNGRQPHMSSFKVKGPYLWVRHPLYLFQLLMIWSCPDLTLDRLLFDVLWTAWIYVGTILEERDLLSDFGDKYRAYQRQVPMLLPWKMASGKRMQGVYDPPA